MGKDIQPEGRQDLLAGLLQDHGLEIGTNHTDDQNTGIYGYQSEQIGQLKFILDGALDMTDQQRGDHIITDGNDHNQQNRHEIFPVRLSIDDEPFYQFAVFHVPVEAHSLLLVLHGNVGKNESNGKGTDDGTNDQKR